MLKQKHFFWLVITAVVVGGLSFLFSGCVSNTPFVRINEDDSNVVTPEDWGPFPDTTFTLEHKPPLGKLTVFQITSTDSGKTLIVIGDKEKIRLLQWNEVSLYRKIEYSFCLDEFRKVWLSPISVVLEATSTEPAIYQFPVLQYTVYNVAKSIADSVSDGKAPNSNDIVELADLMKSTYKTRMDLEQWHVIAGDTFFVKLRFHDQALQIENRRTKEIITFHNWFGDSTKRKIAYGSGTLKNNAVGVYAVNMYCTTDGSEIWQPGIGFKKSKSPEVINASNNALKIGDIVIKDLQGLRELKRMRRLFLTISDLEHLALRSTP